jgi:hypothetical protein
MNNRSRLIASATMVISSRLLAVILVAGSHAREAGAQAAPPSSRRPFDVTHYNVRVEPNCAD